MNEFSGKTYSEVYSILNMLGESYISKIPKSLYDMILEKKLDSYNPSYTNSKLITEQNISKSAMSIIALIHLNYWCTSDKEKNELKEIFSENDKKNSEKYNVNIFEKTKTSVEQKQENVNETLSICEVKQDLFSKIINKIKSFFKK